MSQFCLLILSFRVSLQQNDWCRSTFFHSQKILMLPWIDFLPYIYMRICCFFSLIPHLSMCVHSVPGDVWQSRQSQPCLTLPLWRSSSCLSAPVPSSSKELQVSSESIVSANGSPVCVAFSFLSLTVPIPVLISLVTRRPISQPLLCGSSSQVHGGSLAGVRVSQSCTYCLWSISCHIWGKCQEATNIEHAAEMVFDRNIAQIASITVKA